MVTLKNNVYDVPCCRSKCGGLVVMSARLLSCVALFGLGLTAAPYAATANDLVVPGYYDPGAARGQARAYRAAPFPPPQHDAFGQPSPPPDLYARPSYRQTPFPPEPGPYGGGFVELLMTGGPARSGASDAGRRLCRAGLRAPGLWGSRPMSPGGPRVFRNPRSPIMPRSRRPITEHGPPMPPRRRNRLQISTNPMRRRRRATIRSPTILALQAGRWTRSTSGRRSCIPGTSGPARSSSTRRRSSSSWWNPAERALRYGIGVGRPGFAWSGVKAISRKAEWPDWTPPAEMLQRRPDQPRHMEGGPANPARRTRPLSRVVALPDPRHQRALHDRHSTYRRAASG